jgi:16S rRNA (guanine527-N7)-methyltransferase
MPDLLAVHRRLLEASRDAMNLVGPGSVGFHYEDCRAALAELRPSGRWADLGTGAGFPGIVFAARFPEVALDLVDSRQKRCAFLENVLATAEVGDRVQVWCSRLEDLPAQRWDGVLARALAPPDEVFAHAQRLVRPGGELVLLLQDDQPAPTGAEVLGETPYVVGGKPRRSVRVRVP